MNPRHNEIFYTPEDFTKYMIGKFGSKITDPNLKYVQNSMAPIRIF